jgi:hypothetical protein
MAKFFLRRRTMSFKRLGLLLLPLLALYVAGCGSSASIAPPPSGNYTDSNFSGTYAFSVTGQNSGGFFSAVGTLQADGNGNITGGVEDFNGQGAFSLSQILSGSYSVIADGRGDAALITSFTTIDLSFVLLSQGQSAQIMRFDPGATGSGIMVQQNSNAFSTASIKGPYAFNLSGIDSGGVGVVAAGMFTADGAGNISSGTLDLNDGGVVSSITITSGTYSVASNGRGTLTLSAASGSLDFVFYVVDATHLKLMESDPPPAYILVGDAFSQPTSAITNANLSGSYAFTLGGGASSPYVAGGILTADGNGNIRSGVEDVNNNGTLNENISLTGTYSIASTGRGKMTLNGAEFVIYPTSSAGVQIAEIDTTPAGGVALAQQSSSFSNGSISGKYGYNVSGIVYGTGQFDIASILSVNGSGGITGAADLNLSYVDGTLPSNYTYNGSYSLNSNGHGTAQLTSTTSLGTQYFLLYAVSSSQVMAIEADNTAASIGSMQIQ